jgi:formate dehydrogenase subunit gamma
VSGRRFETWSPTRLREEITALKALEGPLLPVLHRTQALFGYVPPEAIGIIAVELNLTRADVAGVISFYHDFRDCAPGRHRVQICRAEACQAVGARALEAHARQRLGIDLNETCADGSVTLEPVYCLGNCACGPAVRIDDDIHGRVTPAAFDRLVGALAAPGEGPLP